MTKRQKFALTWVACAFIALQVLGGIADVLRGELGDAVGNVAFIIFAATIIYMIRKDEL